MKISNDSFKEVAKICFGTYAVKNTLDHHIGLDEARGPNLMHYLEDRDLSGA